MTVVEETKTELPPDDKARLAHNCATAYSRLIRPIRASARELGYAIGVHGSLVRDIDLIAVPWTSTAVAPRVLAEALATTIKEHNNDIAFHHPVEDSEYFWRGCQSAKPHGRLCWTWHLGDGVYVDLAVIPPLVGVHPEFQLLTDDGSEKWSATPNEPYFAQLPDGRLTVVGAGVLPGGDGDSWPRYIRPTNGCQDRVAYWRLNSSGSGTIHYFNGTVLDLKEHPHQLSGNQISEVEAVKLMKGGKP